MPFFMSYAEEIIRTLAPNLELKDRWIWTHVQLGVFFVKLVLLEISKSKGSKYDDW